MQAVEDVVVGRGEGAAAGDPRGEAPLCPVPSQVEEEGLRVTTGAGGVVGTGVVLGMSLT